MEIAVLVHWQGGKLMVGPVERLEGFVVIVLGAVAVLVVLAVVLAVSQMREIRCALIDACPRAADL
jgi:hypothetical protein